MNKKVIAGIGIVLAGVTGAIGKKVYDDNFSFAKLLEKVEKEYEDLEEGFISFAPDEEYYGFGFDDASATENNFSEVNHVTIQPKKRNKQDGVLITTYDIIEATLDTYMDIVRFVDVRIRTEKDTNLVYYITAMDNFEETKYVIVTNNKGIVSSDRIWN